MELISRPTVVTPPASEPITLAEAKKQCELSPSDTAHDDHLTMLIQAAREQWEHDTDSCCLTQTLSITLPHFPEYIELPRRPIQSVTSITYFDSLNTQKTFSASLYGLDKPMRAVRLNYLELWPTTVVRWDAVTVTYVAGFTSAELVPAVHKQAMLMLIAHYFENRDQLISGALQSLPVYELLVRRFMRSTYP